MRSAILVAILLLSCPAWADRGPMRFSAAGPGPVAGPAEACRTAIALAEQAHAIPARLLAAIARVESGRYDPTMQRTSPWPWTINAEGESGVFSTQAQALAAVRAKQADGVESIDVGCLQVNLKHHPRAFASLEQAFDPPANANYAARFLAQLHAETGDWTQATARYHSATPERGAAYQRKVAAVWPEELALSGTGAPIRATPTPGAIFSAGTNGFLPPVQADSARIIPLAADAGSGRGLAAYRGAPVTVASGRRG